MINHRIFAIGSLLLLLLFGFINLLPYVLISDKPPVKVELVNITTETGAPVDFMEKAGSLSRELARGVARFFNLDVETAGIQDVYIAEVTVRNDSFFDLRLLQTDYKVYLGTVEVAHGSYKRQEPLDISRDGGTTLFLPLNTTVTGTSLSEMLNDSRTATVKGTVWLPVGKRKIRLDYEKDVEIPL